MKHILSKNQISIRKRILEISHEKHLSHLGSCFSTVDLVYGVYTVKQKNDRFILSNGHSGVALYAVLEHKHLITPKDTDSFHLHPDRNVKKSIDVSSGSLGQGLPIAIGMALADKKKKVYCIISDGESAEGSVWEALRIIADNKVNNIVVLVNANGFTAYDKINVNTLFKRMKSFGINTKRIKDSTEKNILAALRGAKASKTASLLFFDTNAEQLPFLKGVDAHYHVMSEEEYMLAMKIMNTAKGAK